VRTERGGLDVNLTQSVLTRLYSLLTFIRTISAPVELERVVEQAEPNSLAFAGLDLTSHWTHEVNGQRWNDLRVVLLGSAAHPLLRSEPGAVNLECEDAVTLAAALRTLPTLHSSSTSPSSSSSSSLHSAQCAQHLHDFYFASRMPLIAAIRSEYEGALTVRTTEQSLADSVRNFFVRPHFSRLGIAASHQATITRNHYLHLTKALQVLR